MKPCANWRGANKHYSEAACDCERPGLRVHRLVLVSRTGLTRAAISVERLAMKKLLAVVLEMAKNAIATITFSRRRVACSVIWLAVVFLPDRVVLGQVVLSGSAMFSGFSQFGYPTGGPLTYTAYTGVDVIPTPTAPDLGGLTNNGATVYDARSEERRVGKECRS